MNKRVGQMRILNKKSDFLFESLNKPGFTLAEVLITLTIVGIIAALTIPTLLNNVQDRENHTKLKKIYSTFSAATQKMASDNSGSLWNDSSADSSVLSKSMRDQ